MAYYTHECIRRYWVWDQLYTAVYWVYRKLYWDSGFALTQYSFLTPNILPYTADPEPNNL